MDKQESYMDFVEQYFKEGARHQRANNNSSGKNSFPQRTIAKGKDKKRPSPKYHTNHSLPLTESRSKPRSTSTDPC
ncbi:hypothetical protein ACLGA7_05070 [Helicobacter pylori]|uniref:hypothetical protein n=1 Tax=Helicobacter pylori TaxID=210 RepID=UPI002078BA94|nr:hypothetical protein [Helicobacter pylori]